MKIGMISPPWLPVPPPRYGGIEIVVWGVTEALLGMGQDVLLFAPGDSRTSARLLPTVPEAIGQDWPGAMKGVLNEVASRYAYARSIVEGAHLVHDHTLVDSGMPIKALHTLHGPADPDLVAAAERISAGGDRNFFVAISNRQRELYGPGVNFVGTVYHGVDVQSIPLAAQKNGYLFFIGRAGWEKGLDLAVKVAVRSGVPLVMTVKMTERSEREYFDEHVRPLLGRGEITMLKEASQEEKYDLYSRALGTLFTSRWEEPFGLVMIESMAAGTPVIALRRGAAPEVIVDGVTGFLGDGEDDLVEAVGKLGKIDPCACRRHVEENFTYEKEARDYLDIYQRVLKM